MAITDRSFSRLPLIGGAVAVFLVLGVGGAFLRLGMTATPPAQTMVHKDLSGGAFAPSTAPQAALPAMPPVPAAQPAQAPAVTPMPASAPAPAAAAPAAPAAAPLTPSTPLPTMPAPKAAPAQPMPATPVAPAPAH
ncbi:hypothetical protein HKD24_00535 [Gluconobacter sp. LMG 31484]|uniref:Uncharacterized protein n=1 Tax=Gluconobacter vitians TaxID=2728102 RepID=A0ABR9Y186_9PROT|nr:hypothetical protein [Gluconobacter vitians]MBF0857704.1 hypothetical protein [Gluconobacter vitians]